CHRYSVGLAHIPLVLVLSDGARGTRLRRNPPSRSVDFDPLGQTYKSDRWAPLRSAASRPRLAGSKEDRLSGTQETRLDERESGGGRYSDAGERDRHLDSERGERIELKHDIPDHCCHDFQWLKS